MPPDPRRRGPGGTVLTCGTFDLPHYGHYRLLQRARSFGDRLVVGVHDGSHGKRTVMTQLERIETIIATGLADAVLPYSAPLAIVQHVRPDRIVQGDDWFSTGPDREAIAAMVPVILVPRTPGICTADLKARLMEAS